MPHLTVTASDSILASGDATKRDQYELTFPAMPNQKPLTALRLEVLPHESLPAGGPGMAYYEGRRGDFFLSRLTVHQDGQDVPLDRPSVSYGNISVGSGKADAANVLDTDNSTGWSTAGKDGQANRLVVHFAEPLDVSRPWTLTLLFERHFVAALGHFRVDVTSQPGHHTAKTYASDLQHALSGAGDVGVVGQASEQALRRHFVATSDLTKQQRRPLEAMRKKLPAPIRTLVMRERPDSNPRQTFRHHRGEYLQPKENVVGQVPSMFADQEDEPRCGNRLEFARWLVSEDNPLVGRVVANRAWRQFFGTGLLRTAGDFGTQSEPPSHPELLNWLDRDLRQHGWSLKRLHRMIVLSATYQQKTGGAPEQDPDNRLLSCFSHRRYDAERIRDAMLAASGLLTRRVGGPSVYPPQPVSVQQIAYGRPNWPTSSGGDRYRRSLYTYSKRTAPFAAYLAFDGPSGETCLARRDRSTTPLQALTMLNDAMFIEIAQALADDVVGRVKAGRSESGETTTQHSPVTDEEKPVTDEEKIIRQMFRRLLVRRPEAWEVDRILAFYQNTLGLPTLGCSWPGR